MFNLYNRHGDAGWAIEKPLLFVGLLLFVAGPFVFLQLTRSSEVRAVLLRSPPARFLACVSFVPFGIFALLSGFKDVGLHWLLSFTPPLFMLAALLLRPEQLLSGARWMGALSLLLAIVVGAVALQPIERFRSLRAYGGIVQTFAAEDLFAALKEFEGRYIFATDGYSPSVTLCGRWLGPYSSGRVT